MNEEQIHYFFLKIYSHGLVVATAFLN